MYSNFNFNNKRKSRFVKKFISFSPFLLLVAIIAIFILSSKNGWFGSKINDLNGSITGNTYECQFYSNGGQKFMTVEGQKIDIKSNTTSEPTVVNGSIEQVEGISSVISIIIDGHSVESCGTTVLFIEKGLKPNVEFTLTDIHSNSDGIEDNVIIANVVNKYRNLFGKSRVVVIQSQLGNPICAFSGNNIYYEVCSDLPKTTKLMVDGKALYIHRANFQIIDKELLGG